MMFSIFSFSRHQQYYDTAGKKVVDFLIGVVLTFLVAGFLILNIVNRASETFMLPAYLLLLLICFLPFFFGRKWVGIGAIALLALVALLAFAALFGI